MKQYINIPILFLHNYIIIRYRQNTNMEKKQKQKKTKKKQCKTQNLN
jgi:hypothetical protein